MPHKRRISYLSPLLIILMCVISVLLYGFSKSQAARIPSGDFAAPANVANDKANGAWQDYGKLPLSFIANAGQADSQVKFLSRGIGYNLFLTPTEAVLVLATPPEGGKGVGAITEHSTARASSTVKLPSSHVLSMKLIGANPNPVISGVEELPGKVNYLLGNEADKWHTNVRTYSKVEYRSVYPGVDLLYYGNQQQLEYDFIVSPGTDPGVIELAFHGARKLELNKQGDLVVKTSAGDVQLHKPIAYQELNGQRIDVASRYVLKGAGRVGFRTGRYDRNSPLVIDPVLAYSTYLGGNSSDRGASIAVDSSGNAFVTGYTFSSNFPTSGSSQPPPSDLTADVFVTKLNAAGSAAVYSTLIGGSNDDIGNGIALDAAGNAYVTGSTGSVNFPTVNALHATSGGASDAFIAELNSTGSALIYSTYLGGGSGDGGNAIALDSGGNVYVTGQTNSRDFPVGNAFQAVKSGNNLFRSNDGAGTWNPSDTGMTAFFVNHLVVDPQNPSLIYAATDTGIFKSTDGGSNWLNTSSGQISSFVNRLAINPANTSIIYATTAGGVYKSTDGGSNWVFSNSGIVFFDIQPIVINPTTPGTLYVAVGSANYVYKSTDGGATWSSSSFINGANAVSTLAIDPTSPSTLYAGTNVGVYKSTNSGTTWSAINTGMSFQTGIRALVIDKNNPLTLYTASNAGVYKTTDGGSHWVNIGLSSSLPQINLLALDPINSSVIYATTQSARVYKSTDGGASWTQTSTGSSFNAITALTVNPANPSLIYLGTNGSTDVFVTKLAAGGFSQTYCTYLGGSGNEAGYGIAADASGNAYVVGSTNSSNFPVANALQPNRAGLGSDAFITKLNAAGSALTYSTYLGGDSSDIARAIALDSSGNAYVTGSTSSPNFPVVGAMQGAYSGVFTNDAFVTKLNAAGSAHIFSTYLGGDDDDQGYGIAVDALGSSYITGTTRSLNFPTGSSVQAEKSLSADVFVTKLTPSGATSIYSTYVGGSGVDEGSGIALDSAGHAYVVGTTTSFNFPTANPMQATRGANGDAFVLKIHPAVNLSVAITDSPDPVKLGDDLTYTVSVKNDGDLTATGVTLNDTLPVGSTFVSVGSTQGACSGTGPITCAIGTLNPGAGATITIVIKPPVVKTITNAASVSGNEQDGNPANNSATHDTQVTFADLYLSSTTAYNKVAPGATVNYLFAVKNNSGSTADSVTLTDNLPSGLTFVSCIAQGGVCSGSGNNVTVTFSTLAVGQSALVVVVATVDNVVAEGTTLGNTATLSSAIPDPDSSNNSGTTSINVTATPLRQKTNGKIAFSTSRIYTVKDDGSEAPTPFPAIPNAGFPTWSPDGTKLAFLTSKFRPVYPNDSYTEINVVNADGTSIVPIADNSADFGFDTRSRFDWSPDGTRIAYVGKDRTIYIANTDGTGFSKLPNSPTQVKDIDWSPDGSKFLFSQLGVIYVMNVDGSGLTKLRDITSGADGSASNLAPSWSPDMSKILFTQRSNNYSDVFIMNSDGTGAQRLFNAQYTDAPAWSPDGTKVAFYQSTEVHVMKVDGSGDVKLATGEGCCGFGAISWQPIPTDLPLEPAPPVGQTYSISGSVVSSNNGAPLYFTKVILSGTRSATFNVDSSATYKFVNLPAGGNYTVTTTSDAYTFSPPSRTFNNLSADQTGADFAGTYVPLDISGHVRDTNGNPLANVKVSSVGGFPEGTTFTDANGYYIFPNVQRFRNYTIIVQWWGAYTFEPQSRFLSNPTSSATVDFVGTKQPSHIISGRVTSNDAPGVGLAGVRVNLARDSSVATFVFTDGNGNYTFGEQQDGFNYSVSINDQGGYVYTPRIINVGTLSADQQLNFVRYAFSAYTTLSGKVLDSQGTPVTGVLLTVSGAANMITTTGDNGTYSFLNVPAGLSYTLTPSKAGYSFTPAQQAISNLNSSSNQADFTARLPQTLQLMLDESGPEPNQAAAIDALRSTRDPFPVVNEAPLWNQADRNTRVAVFLANLQLGSGETASAVVVNLVASNGQIYNVTAEAVLTVPGFSFTQVIFRLPDNLASGKCSLKVIAHSQESNTGTIRIGS